MASPGHQPGRFGPYGGCFVSEALMPAMAELERAYASARALPELEAEREALLRDEVGRPTPLHRADRLSRMLGLTVWLKREDACHTGSHHINNALGQVLLARTMSKQRVIGDTGSGQHGVAVATACARLGLQCEVYMGAVDAARQAHNVLSMRALGATVHEVTAGSAARAAAVNEAMRDWMTRLDDSYYCVGSAVGPHPYPTMVRDFQEIIGRETRAQLLEAADRLPAAVVAAVGGGASALGIFAGFLRDSGVRLVGVQAAGAGLASGRHAAPLVAGSVGVLHGARTYVLQTPQGQIEEARSIAAGLAYAGVGPEHAWLKDGGRADYVAVTDQEALQAFRLVAQTEGIFASLEACHALAFLRQLADRLEDGSDVVVCVSGRGDKDLTVAGMTVADPGGEA